MTVADWGRVGGASDADFHRGYGRAGGPGTYIHPPHGGSAPASRASYYEPESHEAPQREATGEGDGSRLGRAANLFGGVLSIALVVGLGLWGYKLAVRDVSGVPVVRALAGPMRIQPDDPGGAVTPHQGLAVNDVAAVGTSAGPVDEVMLAPTPVGLAPEDKPAQPIAAVAAAPARPVTADPVTADPVTAGEIDAAADAAVAEALAAIAGEDFGEAGTARPAVDIIPESVPGVVRSPRPVPRPARLEVTGVTPTAATLSAPEEVVSDAVAEPVDVATGAEIAAASVASGQRLAQLGTFETAELAREQWQATANRFPELFEGRNWTVERAQAGGKTFYRLRAMGFDDLADARNFCAALMAVNTSCIPAVAQ